jgi:adenosine deaminase
LIDRSLPCIDLHRHLDGNVRLQTIVDLAREHGIALPATSAQTLRAHVEVPGVMPDLVAWLDRLGWMTAVLADTDACRRIARENVEDAQRDGLDYVELRFSPYFMARSHRLDPAAVAAAVVAGIAEGRAATGMRVNLIGILSRTFGPDTCAIELEALLTVREHIVALDLAGDEKRWPAELFAPHFKRGRGAGWAVTVHAGEGDGPASIWSALRVLGATRIGHGTAAPHDPALMAYLAEHRIGIESNITSNVQTATVPSFAAHPLKEFLARGVLATINTDDPVISGIDWPHEYEVAAPAAGLSPDDLRTAQRNAVEIAFLPRAEKDALLQAALERTREKSA